jgi:hypothetical protein
MFDKTDKEKLTFEPLVDREKKTYGTSSHDLKDYKSSYPGSTSSYRSTTEYKPMGDSSKFDKPYDYGTSSARSSVSSKHSGVSFREKESAHIGSTLGSALKSSLSKPKARQSISFGGMTSTT